MLLLLLRGMTMTMTMRRWRVPGVRREPELLAPAVLGHVVHLPARRRGRCRNGRAGHVLRMVVEQEVTGVPVVVVVVLRASTLAAAVPAAPSGGRHGAHARTVVGLFSSARARVGT